MPDKCGVGTLGKPDFCGASASQLHIAGDFTFEYCKHVITRRYLGLESSGRCVVEAADGRKEVAFDQEWKRVTGRS
jgi:hypothetical protein